MDQMILHERGAAGRKTDLSKRAAIVEAARHLFAERGLDGMTFEGVAAAAAVSKMTVYKHFADKEALFAAVVWAEADDFSRALQAFGPAQHDLRAALTGFGGDFLRFLARPKVHAFDLLMRAEGTRHPRLMAAFMEAGPRRVFGMLVERLRTGVAEGEVAIPDLGRAAAQILGMWRGVNVLDEHFGLRGPPDEGQIDQHVVACVDMFLRAYKPA